jgi:hypothetical protein
MYAISCSIEISKYAASKYQAFQLTIPGHYSSEIFAGSSSRLQQIPIAFDLIQVVLIGIVYEFGVEKSRDYISEVTKVNILKNEDRYLFGDGYQVGYLRILSLYPVQKPSLESIKAYDLETLDGRMILIHERREWDLPIAITTQLREGIVDYLQRLQERWKIYKNESPVTHRIDQLLNRELAIVANEIGSNGRFHISHLKSNTLDTREIQVEVLNPPSHLTNPTTDEIMEMYHAMASHQFQHSLIQFRKNIRQDLECIHQLAGSFLCRDQSAKRLYEVLQRTRESIHDILDVLNDTIYSVKKELRHDLHKLLLESMDALTKLGRLSVMGSQTVPNVYNEISRHIQNALFVVEQFIPIRLFNEFTVPYVTSIITGIVSAWIEKSEKMEHYSGVDALLKFGMLVPIICDCGEVSAASLAALQSISIVFHNSKKNSRLYVDKVGQNWLVSVPVQDSTIIGEGKSISLVPIVLKQRQNHLQDLEGRGLGWVKALSRHLRLGSVTLNSTILGQLQLIETHLKFSLPRVYLHNDKIRDFSLAEFEMLSMNSFLVYP